MEIQENRRHKRKVLLAILLACAIAFVCAAQSMAVVLRRSFQSDSQKAVQDITTIMDGYTHSFALFEQILQLEMENADDAAEISAYLKQKDAQFQAVEGTDYDGVYLYFQKQFLYSWDTPISVYQGSGYQATERPWYTGAKAANGEIWFSIPYHSYANDYMLSTISRLQPDGETVIAYDIKLGAIQQYADELYFYTGAQTFFGDTAGNVIGASDPLYAGVNARLSAEEWS